MKSNPKLEAARARGVEVLLLTDPIDAFWTSMPQEFEGKPLRSLSQGDVDFGLVPLLDDKKAEDQASTEDDAAVLKAVKEALGDKVSDVRASAAPDRKCGLPGRRHPGAATASSSACWRAPTAAAAPSRSSSSTCATIS